MREFFEASQAAKMVLADMMKFDIAFDRAWDNYNNEWYDNELKESDKTQTRKFILDSLDRWH